jgi:guanylate kinase
MSIIAVAAASGVGKSTFMRTFLQTVPRSSMLTSTTTRAPRESDIRLPHAQEYEYVTSEAFKRLESEGAFPDTFGKEYGTRYGHRTTVIKHALESPNAHLGALFVPGIEMLFDIAREEFFRERDMHAIFLDLNDEEERRRRLRQRGETDEVRFKEELAQWRKLIEKSSDIPFFTLDASQSPEALVHQAINKFGLAHIA